MMLSGFLLALKEEVGTCGHCHLVSWAHLTKLRQSRDLRNMWRYHIHLGVEWSLLKVVFALLSLELWELWGMSYTHLRFVLFESHHRLFVCHWFPAKALSLRKYTRSSAWCRLQNPILSDNRWLFICHRTWRRRNPGSLSTKWGLTLLPILIIDLL